MRRGLRFAVSLLVVLFALPTSLPGQDAASAREFILSAFHLYDGGGHGVPYSQKYYHTSLLALIKADLHAAEKDKSVPLAGTDLFCDCQEWDGIWIQKLDIESVTPRLAQATVSFSVYAPKDRPKDDLRTITYSLVPEHRGWRVYDILHLAVAGDTGGTASLRKLLVNDFQK